MRVIHPSTRRGFTAFRRKAWGQLFGGLLSDARLERSRSVEDAARAAGMEVSKWEAVEAGQVPDWAKACRTASPGASWRVGCHAILRSFKSKSQHNHVSPDCLVPRLD
jgi:hypothetical protein